jgi:hypothetical protein
LFVLSGAGIRSKFFLDLDALILADETMIIHLYIMSSFIDGVKMSEATLENFVKATMGDLAPVQQEIELLLAVFRDAVDDKDVFYLQFVPEVLKAALCGFFGFR